MSSHNALAPDTKPTASIPEGSKDLCREAVQWVVLSVLVLSGHWAGSAVFEFSLGVFDREWHWVMAWLPLPLGVLFLVFIALFYVRLTTRLGMRPKLKRRHFSAIGLAIATLLAAYGAAVSGERTFIALANGWAVRPPHFWGGMLYWLAFVATSSLLFMHKDDLGAVMQFPKQKSSPRKKYLILFLSDLGDIEHQDGVPKWLSEAQATDTQVQLSRLETARPLPDINADLGKLIEIKQKNPKQRWSWEMPMRAIRHHIGTLEQVTVVCSPRSLEQAHWFFTLCHGYFPGIQFHLWAQGKTGQRFERVLCAPEVGNGRSTDDAQPEPDATKHPDVDSTSPSPNTGLRKQIATCEGCDFEDLNTLSSSMFQLLDVLTEQNNVSDHDIMIDFTGGQKTTSLVAACVTFNRPINAQYVRTGGRFERPGEDIISFDMTVDPLAAGPG